MAIRTGLKWNSSVSSEGMGAMLSEAPSDELLSEMDRHGETVVVVKFVAHGEPCVAVVAPGDAEAREAARKAAEALTLFAEDRKDSAE
jgi:hypothetical protein